MVLCRFFLQGSCRFGTKCNNEHLDIKQLVKTDLEAAINGKQWPISCFGPFKDKPSVPSFIEDQSFEEIRWSCYEAKQKNCVDQYVQQFTKEAMEANNKTKAMLQLSPAILDVICRLYDTPVDGANTGLTKNNVNNPFGMGGNVINDATSSIFNKPNNNTFGSGFGNNAASNSSGSVFGGSTTTPAPGIFGGGGGFGSQTQQTSIFSQQAQKPTSLFGGGGTQNSLFGQAQSNPTVVGGIFSQTGQTSNLFPQNVHQQQQTQLSANAGLFGQQGQQTQMNAGGGLFAQQGQVQSSTGANLFSQNIQQQQPNSGNIFAQTMQSQQTQPISGFSSFQVNKPNQTTSVFGQQQNAFGQQNANMFSNMNTNPSGNNANNLFAQALNSVDTSGVFKNSNSATIPAQNIFAQTVQQQQQQQQQMPTNMFAQSSQSSTAMQPPNGFFQQNMQSQQMPNQQNLFAQTMGGNNTGLLQSPVISSSVYSKLEDLSPEDIEAFKAETFTPGRIPNVPPPRELIN
ncbi:nucleoporin NUP100/NSP100-like [Ceratitis capitata]|uniref:Nucleoporin NUP42 n=1 Tax=Ceratitis capitata TaxID=7213 RepID=A0A811ULU2_CERCA|nr:nucleoporin NUP100/NSP100-like [Ceratitis capitata]CAD6998866.1 unnamed protein product [Ceratitis capitata]